MTGLYFKSFYFEMKTIHTYVTNQSSPTKNLQSFSWYVLQLNHSFQFLMESLRLRNVCACQDSGVRVTLEKITGNLYFLYVHHYLTYKSIEKGVSLTFPLHLL